MEANAWVRTYHGDLNRKWYIFCFTQQGFKLALVLPSRPLCQCSPLPKHLLSMWLLKVRCSFTFSAILGGLSEQPFAVVGALKSPLDPPAESNIVLALRGRDGETALLLHG